ncbi:Flagellar motor switch protein FliG [Halomonas chromatireducens]|uniref:Flagellar motor switch protein FliG n=1 Tax=Halomonas chromatireducens TaxID=507626 RepID=A0A125R0T6_9GAMM|nr:Flagellar motor switch protein FliG [Halomonas chromatireducens]
MSTARAMTGVRRSAILMLALDEDSAAEVFKFLGPKEIQQLSMEMADLGQVSHEDMQKVMQDFNDETEEFIALNLNSSEHIRSVLTKALGSERATSLIEDVLESSGTAHASSLMDKYVGGTEEKIAELFQRARDKQAVLLLDEVDQRTSQASRTS